MDHMLDRLTSLRELFAKALEKMPMGRLAPANAEDARQRLAEVMNLEVTRIRQIRTARLA